MPTLFPTSGGHGVPYTGVYNFGDGKLYIPEVSTLPAIDVPDGAIYHVKNSGVLAVHSGVGGGYAVFNLENMALDLGAGSGQSPLEISSGLVAWYDATESPATLSGSGVSSWDDLSSNAYHMSTNDGPPNKGDDGGVSGMELNGTNDMFLRPNGYPAQAWSGNDVPLTVVCAFRKTDAANLGALFCWSSSTSNVTTIAGYSNTDGAPRWFKRDGTSLTFNFWNPEGPMDVSIPTITSWVHHAGTTLSMYASGEGHTVAQSGSDVATLGGVEMNGIGGLNRFGFGKSNWFKGWLYSIAMWNRELTSVERTNIEKNFAERYSVTMGIYEGNQ